MLPTCLRYLHRHYRHYYRHITAKTIFAPTFYTDIYTDKTAATFSVHRPTANWLLSQNYPKRNKNRRNGDYTLLYIGILWEIVGITLLNINNLNVSLCKLRHFHCASWGNFIVQVEAISLCKLRIYHKKMVFHFEEWNTIDLNFMLIIEFRN